MKNIVSINVKNIINVIRIVENLVLGFIKFYILGLCMLGANLDDYLFPLTFFEKMLIIGFGFIIVILLDFVVNLLKRFCMKETINFIKFIVFYVLIIVIVCVVFFLE